MPRMTALHMLRSTITTVSAPASSSFRGSITHPTQPLCTLRVRRYRCLTQHSLPGDLLGLTWAGLAPADRASFAWRLRRGRDASYLASLPRPEAASQPADLGRQRGAPAVARAVRRIGTGLMDFATFVLTSLSDLEVGGGNPAVRHIRGVTRRSSTRTLASLNSQPQRW